MGRRGSNDSGVGDFAVLCAAWFVAIQHALSTLLLRVRVRMKFELPGIIATVMIVVVAMVGEPLLGSEALLETCADCHGIDGASTQHDIPVIGGLSAFALEENLLAFREKARPCRPTFYRTGDPDRPITDMCRITADLSDDDIAEIATFFAAQPFVPATQTTDPEKVARGAILHNSGCHLCHGRGGSDPADHASILAGQWMTYLTMAFINFRTDKRWMPRSMEVKLLELSDEDVDALVHFYGSGGHLHDAH